MSEQNKALVRRWFDEVWSRGRAAAIDEMLSPRAMVHGLGKDVSGAGDFKRFHAAYRDAFPDVAIHIDAMVAEGDLVAVRWRGTGTHRGGGIGIAATGRPVQFDGMSFLRVADGAIVEGWNVYDQHGMLVQLGVVGPPEA